jgi:SSS family solute:Na+ symporter
VIATTLVLLALYLGAILALGIFAHRRSRPTMEDYFLASRSVGLWLLVGTVVATIVNSLAVTGTPALLYEGGVLFGQMFVAAFGSMALMWVFGPQVCKLGMQKGFITQGEIFADHYQSRVVLALTTGLGILSIFPFLAIQLAGIGKVLAATTGGAIPQELAVILCAASIGVYIFLGGARAAVWTDALQGLIVLGIFTGSAVLFSVWVGGLPAGVEKLYQVMPERLVFNSANTPVFIDNILSWTFAFFLWPHIFQRMFMARTPQCVRRSAGVSLVLLNFLLICLLVMTIAATAELYGTLDDPDQLLAAMFNRHLPVGGAFLTIVIFALAMSTIDSMLLTLSSSASRDVWKGLMRREGQSQSSFAHGRWITLAFLMLAALFAVTAIGRGAITPWVTLGASIATLLLWPFLGMFVWKRASTQSVISAMCLGFLAICLTRFTALGNLLPFGFATAGFLVGGVCFLIVGFVTPSDESM